MHNIKRIAAGFTLFILQSYCHCKQPFCRQCELPIETSQTPAIEDSKLPLNHSFDSAANECCKVYDDMKPDIETALSKNEPDVRRSLYFVSESHDTLMRLKRGLSEDKNTRELYTILSEEAAHDIQIMIDFFTLLNEALEESATKTCIENVIQQLEDHQSQFPLASPIEASPQVAAVNGISTAPSIAVINGEFNSS